MSSRRNFDVFNASNTNRNVDQFERDIAPVLAMDEIRADAYNDLREAMRATLTLKELNAARPEGLTQEELQRIEKIEKDKKLLEDFLKVRNGFEKQFKRLENSLDKSDLKSMQLKDTMRTLVSQVTPKLEMQMDMLLSKNQGKIVELTSKNDAYKIEIGQLNEQLIELRTGANMTDAMKELFDAHIQAKEKLTEGGLDLQASSKLYKQIGTLEHQKEISEREISAMKNELEILTKERDELKSSKLAHERIERESRSMVEQFKQSSERLNGEKTALQTEVDARLKRIRYLESAIQTSQSEFEKEQTISSGLRTLLIQEDIKSKGLQESLDKLKNRPAPAADVQAGRSRFLENVELEGTNKALTNKLSKMSSDMVQELAKSAQIPGLNARIRALQEDMERLSTSHRNNEKAWDTDRQALDDQYRGALRLAEERKADLLEKDKELEKVNKSLVAHRQRQVDDADKIQQQVVLINEKDARIDTLLIQVQLSDSLQEISNEYTQRRQEWAEEKVKLDEQVTKLMGDLRIKENTYQSCKLALFRTTRDQKELRAEYDEYRKGAKEQFDMNRRTEEETRREEKAQIGKIQGILKATQTELNNAINNRQTAEKRVEVLEKLHDRVTDGFNRSEKSGYLQGQVELLQSQLQGQLNEANGLRRQLEQVTEDNGYLRIQSQSQAQDSIQTGPRIVSSRLPVAPSPLDHHNRNESLDSRRGSTSIGFGSTISLSGPNLTGNYGHGHISSIGNFQQPSELPQDMYIPRRSIEQSPQSRDSTPYTGTPMTSHLANLHQRSGNPLAPQSSTSSRVQTPSQMSSPALGQQFDNFASPHLGYSSTYGSGPTFNQQFGNFMEPQPSHSSRTQTPSSIPVSSLRQQSGNFTPVRYIPPQYGVLPRTETHSDIPTPAPRQTPIRFMPPQYGASSRTQTPSGIPVPISTSEQTSPRCMFLISGTADLGPRTIDVLPELIHRIQAEMQAWDLQLSNVKRPWDKITNQSADRCIPVRKKHLKLSVAPSSATEPDRFACPHCIENRNLCVLVSKIGPVVAPLPLNHRSPNSTPSTAGYYIKE